MHTEFSWRNPRNKRAYRRPRRKWKDNIKTLYEMGNGRGLDGCGLGQVEVGVYPR